MPTGALLLSSAVDRDGVEEDDARELGDALRLLRLKSGTDNCAGTAVGGKIGVPGAAPASERTDACDNERRRRECGLKLAL